jgi:hypothetical protein
LYTHLMFYATQVIMRCLHFSSLAVLLGGAVYWRLILMPSTGALPPEERDALAERDAAAFRPYVFAAMAGLVISGLFNILSYPGHNMTHNIVLAVKLLLVAHVFAAAMAAVRKNNPRRARMLAGVVASGAVILAVSAYLRVFY